MAKRFIILLILLIAICYATKVSSQETMLNFNDIKDLLRSGVSSEMILELIKEQGVNFKATAQDLSELRGLGANDDVIAIILVTIKDLKEKDVKSSGNQSKGHSEARVILIEYADYQCPFCGRFFKGTFPDIKREYIDTGKVEYIFKDFPLEFHKQAPKAAEAANCAGDQEKYWEMHGKLFENQNNLSVDKLKSYAKDMGISSFEFERCLDSAKFAEKVAKDIAEGKKEGVNGTPYFILGIKTGNGLDKKKMMVGARPFSAYKQEIDALLISVKNEDVNRWGGKPAVTDEDFINLEAKEKKKVVLIETSMGNIKMELDEAKAPITVKNFLSYVDEKFYDGAIFHRIINNFMIQGGGFTQDMQQKKTKAPVKNEAGNGLKNKRGTIAMARTMVVDSATAQFFINVIDNDFLDHRDETPQGFGYAVFGKVSEGMDVVDKIKAVRTGSKMGSSDVPLEAVVIKSVKRAQ